MAKTIPQLTDATTVNAADELIIQQAGVTKRATATELFSGTATVTSTGSTTGRSLKDRFADVVNVKDFGAVGNGVADDTEAIQDAIAYARNSATTSSPLRPQVYFPAGDYAVTTITLNSHRGIKFVGENTLDAARRRSRLKFIGEDGDDALLILVSCQFLDFEGLVFYSNNKNSLNSLVLFQANASGASSPLSNLSNNWITFRDCAFFVDLTTTTKPDQTIWAKSCSTVTFDRCRIMSGALVALKLGADSDVAPGTSDATLANGICTITSLRDCYVTGDIVREKSYMLQIRSTQFGIVDSLNSAIGGTGPRRPSRIKTSGNAVCFSERITGNVWDNTETDSFSGVLIASGNNAASALEVTSNQLAGQTTLVQVNNGSALVAHNRGIPVAGVADFTNRFVRCESGARTVQVFGNNNEEWLANNTGSAKPSVLLHEGRSSKFLPILTTSNLGADVTLPTAGTFVSLLSSSHKFAGEYVRISYSACIRHEASDLRTYQTQVVIDGTEVEALTRRVSAANAGQFTMLSASHVVYVTQAVAAVTIALRASQVTGTTLGIVQGNSLAQTSFTVELLNP